VSRRQEWAAITLILLLAAALRLWGLGQVPPGLAHDEVANWLIAQDILAGRHAIYFTAAYGHEPLYQYVQAASVALFGDHWLGLRYPSVAFGLLGIAVTYALARRLFGVPVALLAVAWLATSFWPLFYARVALRAITLPFTAALAAYFLLRATHSPTSHSTAPGVINLHSPFSILHSPFSVLHSPFGCLQGSFSA
jgi:4-amino-4-deoxy-L-arabinose transferase-like glycosyltransferase